MTEISNTVMTPWLWLRKNQIRFSVDGAYVTVRKPALEKTLDELERLHSNERLLLSERQSSYLSGAEIDNLKDEILKRNALLRDARIALLIGTMPNPTAMDRAVLLEVANEIYRLLETEGCQCA